MPRADLVTADVILKQDFPKICVGTECSPRFQEIRRQLAEFQKYYQDNRDVIDEVPPTTEQDVIYTMAFIAFYMFVGSFRLGRSGAEFERNRLAQREAKEKSKQATSKGALEDIHRRLAHIEEMIATLRSDSDTFERRHVGLKAVGRAASRRDAWRAELAHLSGTAKGLLDRKTTRAALTALLARVRMKFRVEKMPIEGRWEGADPVTASLYGLLTINRSTMCWGGQGRSRARYVGTFALKEDGGGAYFVDVHVAGHGPERDRLKLAFPIAGNADHMEMTEYRQGKPVRRLQFHRRQ
jgi:hypothetical protein